MRIGHRFEWSMLGRNKTEEPQDNMTSPPIGEDSVRNIRGRARKRQENCEAVQQRS